MSDDIVAQLRMSADLMQGFPQMKAQHFNAEWVIEAADEIERLRKLTSELAQIMMEFSLLMTSEEQQKILKAVRDE